MPIYEYRCQTCQTVFEKLVRGGKEPTACPECGAETLTRLISRAGVIFKGSGFYVTDTKSKNSGSSSSSSSESSKSSSESSSGDSSSKSDSKSPSSAGTD